MFENTIPKTSAKFTKDVTNSEHDSLMNIDKAHKIYNLASE